ncbi:hypothetical protein L0Z72_00360 [candidate division KSB1 bacterium]|nr:hypothetical protein [candidate division KSB1 bacterium]
MDKITLRKFPYPYQAAMTICNDIDGTSLSNFIEIHRFLNTYESTSLGEGLGLPISDSFWMFDNPILENSAFSYFEKLGSTPSNAAPLIRDFIKAGILDVMHSYGNFVAISDFSRKMAAHSINELDRYNLKVKVWTNHGGIESIQNIGNRSWGKGDLPTHEGNGTAAHLDCYHSDLLIDYGIRFYWDSVESLTSLVGQDSPVNFSEAYWRSPLYSGFKLKTKSIIKGYISFADLLHFKFTKRHFVPWQPFDAQNQLIQFDQLRDGNILLRFKRYGHNKLDWSDDLDFLLNEKVLNHLIKKAGYLVLYIHLGNVKSRQESTCLPVMTINKLRQIAELYHQGRLWVQTVSKLLMYNFIHRSIKWQAKETDSNYQIHLEGFHQAVFDLHLSLEDLGGLTFIAPADKEVLIFFNDRAVATEVVLDKNASRQFIKIPIPEIKWPL